MSKIETAYEIHEIVYRHYISVSSTGDGARDSYHTIPLEEPLVVQHTQVFQGGQTRPLLVNEVLNNYFTYIVIRDEEKAVELFRAIHDFERYFEMPEEYHNGDLIAWDADNYEYVDLCAQRDELNRKINAIEKAVSQLG